MEERQVVQPWTTMKGGLQKQIINKTSWKVSTVLDRRREIPQISVYDIKRLNFLDKASQLKCEVDVNAGLLLHEVTKLLGHNRPTIQPAVLMDRRPKREEWKQNGKGRPIASVLHVKGWG